MKFTRSGIPVPLDSSGREMCLLFIKYGRCRFKNKCKKSHWTPPLPDEEYPKPPPLPLSPLPSFAISNTSTEAPVTNQSNFVDPEHTLPTPEATYYQSKCTPLLQEHSDSDWIPRDLGCSNLQEFWDVYSTSNQEQQELSSLGLNTNESQLLIHHPLQGDIQNDSRPGFTTNNLLILPTYTSFVCKRNNLEANSGKEIHCTRNPSGMTSSIDLNVAMQAKETTMDRISQVIFKKRCRFDFVFHPERQLKGTCGKFKSSIDLSYQQYGAYYSNVKKKLEFHNQPRNKVERKNFKLLRKAHWNTSQELKRRLAQRPPGYSLKVDFSRVNFNRLRPYFYLLVHQCFFYQDPSHKRWKPHPFSCLVTETLIALFLTTFSSPLEAEAKMEDWGGRPVKVRQCVSHMWEIIVKSSLSVCGVAKEVLNCERKVFAKKLSALDYAYACTLAGPLIKGNADNVGNISLPTITTSVRLGIQKAKQASLSRARRALLKAPELVETFGSKTRCRTIKAGSVALGPGSVRKTNKMNFKGKKRKTNRSTQLLFLDEQGRQDLQKRCKTILAEKEVQVWN